MPYEVARLPCAVATAGRAPLIVLMTRIVALCRGRVGSSERTPSTSHYVVVKFTYVVDGLDPSGGLCRISLHIALAGDSFRLSHYLLLLSRA